MLAASPSASPNTFKYSASRNGQSRSANSSYQPSPRYTASLTQKSPKIVLDSTAKGPPKSPPSRANYQDASTQYSPMTDAVLEQPLTTAAEKPQVESKGAIPLTTAPVTSTQPAAQIPSRVSQIHPPSPTTKRRQLKEAVDVDSSLAKSQTSASKRAKSSKTPVKILPNR